MRARMLSLRGRQVDAKSKYGHLNTAMFVGSGLRNGKQGEQLVIPPHLRKLTLFLLVLVIYDAYQVM